MGVFHYLTAFKLRKRRPPRGHKERQLHLLPPPPEKQRQLRRGSRAERAASTGAPPWDPVQGLLAGAPSPALPPVRTRVRSPSNSSGVREAARRARVQTKSSRNPFPRLMFTTADLREDCRPGHQTAERTPGSGDAGWAHTQGAAVDPDKSGLSEPLPSLRPLGAPQRGLRRGPRARGAVEPRLAGPREGHS